MLLVTTNHVVRRILIITILRDVMLLVTTMTTISHVVIIITIPRDGELPKMSVIPTVEDTSTGNGSKVNPQSIS